MTASENDTVFPIGFPLIRNVGFSGILISFSDVLSDPANLAALAFRASLEAEGISGIIETSTSLTSTYVSYDPLRLPLEDLRKRLTDLLSARNWDKAVLPSNRKRWRIPAVFGGEDGPQLEEAASLAGLPSEQAIAEITAAPLRVMTIGFAPGQPYLGILPDSWNIPRQGGLTAQVPAGSLVVAIRQLVLFTNPSPTGWRRIGQTAFRLFRQEMPSPFALKPGDEVQFIPVSAQKLDDIRAADTSGDGGAGCESIA